MSPRLPGSLLAKCLGFVFLYFLPTAWMLRAAPGEGEKKAAPTPAPDASATPAASEPKPPARLKIDEGLDLVKAHKYDEAFKAFGEALVLNPPAALASEALFQEGDVWFRKAMMAKSEKLPGVDPETCFREATKVFEEVLKKYPSELKTADAVYMIGSSYLMLEETEKALAYYRKTYNDYPKFADRSKAQIRIGVCQAGLDDAPGAQRTFLEYLRANSAQKAEAMKVRKYQEELSIVGSEAPSFAGHPWLLGAVGSEGLKTFEGEVVAVVFFATWCENCSEEMPHLRGLIKRWGPKGVTFIGVANPKDPKNKSPIDVYVQKNEIAFVDVALDATASLFQAYKVGGMPAGVIIDRKGRVRWRGHPAFFPGTLVNRILAEK